MTVIAAVATDDCACRRPTSLADVVRAATAGAFSKPVEPTPEEMFDDLCRKAGLPTMVEELTAAHARLVEDALVRAEHVDRDDWRIVIAP